MFIAAVVVSVLLILGIYMYGLNRILGMPWKYWWAALLAAGALFGIIILADSFEKPPLAAPAVLVPLSLAAAIILALRIDRERIWIPFLVSSVYAAAVIGLAIWLVRQPTEKSLVIGWKELLVGLPSFLFILSFAFVAVTVITVARFGLLTFVQLKRTPPTWEEAARKRLKHFWWIAPICFFGGLFLIPVPIGLAASLGSRAIRPMASGAMVFAGGGALAVVAIHCHLLKSWRSFGAAIATYAVILATATVYSLNGFGLSLPESLDGLVFLFLMCGLLFMMDIVRRLSLRFLRKRSASAAEGADGQLEKV